VPEKDQDNYIVLNSNGGTFSEVYSAISYATISLYGNNQIVTSESTKVNEMTKTLSSIDTICTLYINESAYDSLYIYVTASENAKLVYSGYTFLNWNTASDGSGTSYNVGDKIYYYNYYESPVTYYAQWSEDTTSYAVNLVTGEM